MPRRKQRPISAPENIVLPVPVWPSTIALWLVWPKRSRTIGASVRRAIPYRWPDGSYRSEAAWSSEAASEGESRLRSATGRGAGPGRTVDQASARRKVAGSRSMSAALRLQAQQLEPLAQAGPIGRLDQEHGVDQIHPTLAGVDPPPTGDRGRAEALALDVGELAALGRPAARRRGPDAGGW